MNKVTEGLANEFVADEFVVVTPHRDLVLQRLTGTGVTVARESPELGLSLLKLADVDRAAEQVRRQREEVRIDAPALEDIARHLPLEHLMADLRALYRHEFGGWTPTMGKNRVMRGIQLFPYPSYGGETMPQPVKGRTAPEYTLGDPAGGERARVMVLDTQISPHEYLTGRFIADPGALLTDDAGIPKWWKGHATFVSGLIVQRAPAVQLGIESVLNVEGGSPSVWDVAVCMVRSARFGADIFNLSFGCHTIDGQPPLVLTRAVERLAPTTVLVAAAGNHGAADSGSGELPRSNTPMWPAAFDGVIAVGASDSGGKPAPFSPPAPWVDFLAPGVDVESTYLTGDVRLDKGTETFTGVARWSGTSFAAAAVSGAIASGTVPGRRTAHEALEDLRTGAYGRSGTGIEVAQLPGR